MRRLFGTLLAASLCGAAALPAQNPAAWTDTTTPFRVIGNIHYVGSAGLSAWLITTPAGHILLDVGLPQNAAMVARNIERLGYRVRDVKVLLNSHAHFDHSGGLAEMKRMTGARLLAMAGDRTALEQGVYVGSESRMEWREPPVRVDSVLADGSTVTLGGTTLTAHNTAGHTAGCTTWTMPITEGGQPLQVLFYCSASVAANRLAPDPQYPGIVADYERTFVTLRRMRADVFLAPHAELFDLHAKRARMAAGGRNPFIDATALGRIVAAQDSSFRTELARQRTAR